MFVMLTGFSLWLGWQANWIRQRHAAIEQYNLAYWTRERVPSPGLLWLFGEAGYPRLVVSIKQNGDKSEVRRIEQLFPEADVEAAYWRP